MKLPDYTGVRIGKPMFVIPVARDAFCGLYNVGGVRVSIAYTPLEAWISSPTKYFLVRDAVNVMKPRVTSFERHGALIGARVFTLKPFCSSALSVSSPDIPPGPRISNMSMSAVPVGP